MEEEKDKELEVNESMVSDSNKLDEEEFSTSKYWPYLFIFTVLLFFCIFGITYSVYKGDSGSDSEIITDQIIFSYMEVDKVGNGIFIHNATPISDVVGKSMVGKNQYFDFYITATTGNSNVIYQLLIDKDETSTLSNKNIRIYLTQTLGAYENPLILDSFSNLKLKKVNGKEYYVLYEKRLPGGLVNYNESYRLRMWIAQNATDYDNQKFSIKVDVYAEQLEE